MRKLYLLLAAIGILGGIGVAVAAPNVNLFRNVGVETDSAFYNGTSSAAWLWVVSDQFCLTGDSCISTWPAGGPGGGSTTTIQGLTPSNGVFILATGTATGLDLLITTSSPRTITFTPQLQSGYNIPLTASTTNWNNFYDTPSTRITAGNYLAWSGNTLNGSSSPTYTNLWVTATSTLATTTVTGNIIVNNRIKVGYDDAGQDALAQTSPSPSGNGFNIYAANGTASLNAESLYFYGGQPFTGGGGDAGSIVFQIYAGDGVGAKGKYQFGSTAFNSGYLDFESLTGDQTYTFPDLTGTFALLQGTQTFSGLKTFTATTTMATTSIPALSNLTSNGFVKTNDGTGRLTVDTSTYLTGNQTITLSGDVTGSGTTAITTTYNNIVPIAKGGTATATAPSQTGQILAYDGVATYGPTRFINGANIVVTTSTAGSITIAATGLQPAGTYVTSVTGTSPIVSSGGTTPAISVNTGDLTLTSSNLSFGSGDGKKILLGTSTNITLSSTPSFTTLTVTATTTLAATTTLNGATYFWPSSLPAGNRILQSSNTGVLSWVADQTGGGGGATTTITANNTIEGPNFTFSTSTTGSGTLKITTTGATVNFALDTSSIQGGGNSAWTIGNGLIYNATSTDSVLIGTSTPTTAQLFVQGSGTKDPLRVASSSGTSYFIVEADGDVLIPGSGIATGVKIGNGASASFANNIAIGTSAVSSGNNSAIAIGSSATASNTESVAIGTSAVASGYTSVAIGSSPDALAGGGVAIGQNATVDTPATNGIAVGVSSWSGAVSGVAIGDFATINVAALDAIAIGSDVNISASATSSIAIGANAVMAYPNSLALGHDATSEAANQIVFDTDTGDGSGFNQLYLGQGIVSVNNADFYFNMSGENGTNRAGHNFYLVGSRSTGNANGGGFYFSTADAGGSGTTLNTTSTKMVLTGPGNLGIGTTTPEQLLVVVGSTTITSLNASACDVKSTLQGNLYCGTDATGAGSGNAAWTIGSGLIYNATSTDAIGIGTSTPDNTLTIQGNGSINPFRIASSSGTNLLTLTTGGNLTIAGTISGSNLSGTNTGDVTLAGENYLSLSGQQITAADISLTTNVTGVLPIANGGTNTSTAPSSQGQLLAYDGTAAWAPTTLVAGTQITITTSTKGQITLANGYGTAIDPTELASTDFGDFTCNAGTCTLDATYLTTIGSGNRGFGARWNGTNTLAQGALIDDGTVLGIGASTTSVSLTVKGIGGNNAALVVASSSGTTLFQVTPAGIASTTNVNISALGTCSNGLVTTSGGVVACNGSAFLTGNQTITLTGAVTGSGATSIATVFQPGAFATGTSGTIFNIATTTTSLTINLPTASAVNTGQLSATDWSTFNNKQTALSGGTNGFNTIWTSSSALGVGKFIDNGSITGINATSSTVMLNIQGTAGNNTAFNVASSTGTSILQVTAGSEVLVAASAYLRIPVNTTITLTTAGQIAVATSTSVFTFHDGTAQRYLNPVDHFAWTIENPATNEDDSIWMPFATSTIVGVRCINKGANDSANFNIIWDNSRRTATSSSTNLISSFNNCNATTTPSFITSFANTVVNTGQVVRYINASASSSQFTIDIYYRENQ